VKIKHDWLFLDMKQNTYRVLLNKEQEGGYTAIVPMLPGCITYGESLDEAVENVKEAIELYIESLRAHNEPIPNEENTFEYSVSVTA
jgi:predicted RNase H-like HicB family nuclease